MFDYKNKKNILITILLIGICLTFPEIKEPTLMALKLLLLVISHRKEGGIDVALIELIIFILECC